MNPNLLGNFVRANSLQIDPCDLEKYEPNDDPYITLLYSIKSESDGKYELAKEFAEKAMALGSDDPIINFGSRIMSVFVDVRMYMSYNLENSLRSIEKMIPELESSDNTYSFYFLLAIFYTVKSTYHFYTAQYSTAVEDNLLAIRAWRKINEIDGENLIEIDLQFCYIKTGELDNALKSSDKLISRLDPENDKLTYCHALLSRSEIFQLLGDFRETEQLLEKAYEISKELDNEPLIFHASRFLAKVYTKRGRYSDALGLQQEVEKYFSSYSNSHFKALIYNDMGMTYRSQKKYDTAVSFFLKSIDESIKIGVKDETMAAYYNLVLTEISHSSREEKLNSYLAEVNDLITEEIPPHYRSLPKLISAIVLSSSKRFSKKFRAIEAFSELLQDEELYHEFKLDAMYFLSELLIEEYRYSKNPNIIEDIETALETMYGIGSSMHSTPIIIDYYILMARMKIEVEEYTQAREYMEEANTKAMKSGVKDMINYVSAVDQVLEEEINILKNNETHVNLETFHSVSDYIQTLRNGLIPTVESTVLRKLFFIISPGGNLIYSQDFGNPVVKSVHLVAPFLRALSSFSEEVFTEKINLIRIGEDTLILHPHRKISLCYIFRGNSGLALRQVKSFSKELDAHNLTEKLHDVAIHSSTLKAVSEIVGKVFE